MKDRLVELLDIIIQPGEKTLGDIADHLIANGVTLPDEKMKNRCPWCQNKKGKTDLDFSVIDDNAGQYTHPSMINYCPFCGRKLKGGANK